MIPKRFHSETLIILERTVVFQFTKRDYVDNENVFQTRGSTISVAVILQIPELAVTEASSWVLRKIHHLQKNNFSAHFIRTF